MGRRSLPRGAAAAAGLVALLAAGAAPPRTARAAAPPGPAYALGVVPYFTAEKLHLLWEPVLRHINERTPERWELALGRNHDELVAALCAGEVAVAYLGPIPFGKALRRCDPRPLVVTLAPDGKPTYHAVIATADPGIAFLGDLRGRGFAVFERSTAAHYVPLRMLAEAGVSRGELRLLPVASQDRIVAMLLTGEADAGGLKESLFERFRGSGLRQIAVSGELPSFIFAASPALPEAAGRALAEALLPLRPLERPADRERVKGWDPELANGFAPPPEGYREQVRELLSGVEPFLAP